MVLHSDWVLLNGARGSFVSFLSAARDDLSSAAVHSRYGVKLPANGVEVNYIVSAGKCSAFYIPSRDVLPKRLWIAFCGNGSLALDWLANILVNYPVNDDAFLLVDYPGYGKNGGYAMIDSTRASADAAVRALEERLHMPEERLTVCAVGHSLGAAVALDFATRHRVERVVAISPFTTLREEAARVVGRQLARLLRETTITGKILPELPGTTRRRVSESFMARLITIFPSRWVASSPVSFRLWNSSPSTAPTT